MTVVIHGIEFTNEELQPEIIAGSMIRALITKDEKLYFGAIHLITEAKLDAARIFNIVLNHIEMNAELPPEVLEAIRKTVRNIEERYPFGPPD